MAVVTSNEISVKWGTGESSTHYLLYMRGSRRRTAWLRGSHKWLQTGRNQWRSTRAARAKTWTIWLEGDRRHGCLTSGGESLHASAALLFYLAEHSAHALAHKLRTLHLPPEQTCVSWGQWQVLVQSLPVSHWAYK